ncbi:CooT family nickel-binding protein [Sporomusa sp. KB1]|jgi:predicted RNA-binding protein|uniref:CooT family nickel-binding protein n=1 Tax=Sporomusa sp. KB1 TaxID=943346 RepID=UPI0011A2349E|nr:CooT family nickel-binding protein [Sporomusa sp. KB1]TWH51633.1 putative RNA-binding protein [Sporomusa sp. KB1]TWH52212.1 putative RNA-binding protein [Sporomusa sp. KB1]
MCEANAYLLKDNKEELLMERVDRVVPQNGEIYLESIWGQRTTIAARIKELNLVDHRIILEPAQEGSN